MLPTFVQSVEVRHLDLGELEVEDVGVGHHPLLTDRLGQRNVALVCTLSMNPTLYRVTYLLHRVAQEHLRRRLVVFLCHPANRPVIEAHGADERGPCL